MSQRSRIAWLPILLSLYLLVIIAYIALTRAATLAAGHPAYPITLGIVALGAIITIVVAVLRGRRG